MARARTLNLSGEAAAVMVGLVSLVMLTVSCGGTPVVSPTNSAAPSATPAVSPATPSPAPTMTVAPTPTVTATPTVVPTATPTPPPTATASLLPTPTATPSLPPSPTPSPTPVSGEPQLVADINPSGASYPTELTQVGDEVFFAADDGVHGAELWKSNGTAAGTTMVKDIWPGAKGSRPGWLTNVNGTLFFVAASGKYVSGLWKSDGTAAGTAPVMTERCGRHPYCCGISIAYPPVAVDDKLFFVQQCGGVWSAGLYVSDGTAAGTHWLDTPTIARLEDWGSGPGRVADKLGGKLYFVVGDWEGDAPQEIWVTDGTDAGTHRMDGSPTADQISFLPAHGTKLYFLTSTYDNWWDEDPVPDRLWRTDGTPAGTFALTTAGDLTSAPTQAVLMGDRLYFDSGDALWRTNGTAQGTQSISSGEVGWLTSAGGKLYFTRDQHLWKSDGTTAGTTDLGQFGVYGPSHLVGIGTELCFAAIGNDGAWALWESDGTSLGTNQIGAYAGTPDVIPQATVGSQLFFAANDITHGMELWSYTP